MDAQISDLVMALVMGGMMLIGSQVIIAIARTAMVMIVVAVKWLFIIGAIYVVINLLSTLAGST